MNWQLVPNSSWGENQKQMFGEKNLRYGYVICERNKHRELIAIASIHTPFKDLPENIEKRAKLIVNAPAMFELLEKLAENNVEAKNFISSFHNEKV